MSCILTIGGADFIIDDFIDKHDLNPYKRSYKGYPKFKSNPDGEKLVSSSFSIEVSLADFADPEKQLNDAILFLIANEEWLSDIQLTSKIDYAILDFGFHIIYEHDFCKSIKIKNDLLLKAANFGLEIQLSFYSVDNDDVLTIS